MARKYKIINYEDRKKIERMIKNGVKTSFIAEEIGVHYYTLLREMQRGGGGRWNHSGYRAEVAQRSVLKRG